MKKSILSFVLLCLALVAVAGCGGTDSGSNIGATSTIDVDEGARPNVSTIQFNFVLARQVPAAVNQFRFTGFNGNGQTIFGSITRDKNGVVTLTEVPISVTRMRIEYLVNSSNIVGSGDIPLDLIGGETVNVSDPDFEDVVVTSLAVTPNDNNTVAVGGTLQLTATATFSNGTTTDVTNNASWSSSLSAVASVSSTGGVNGVTVGSANITASFSGQTGSAGVTVTPNAAN